MNAVKHTTTPTSAPTSDIRCLAAEEEAHGPGRWLCEKLELRCLCGRGGMGEVWIARHHLLEIDVAVKMIRSDRLTASSAERLLSEARAAARVSDPAIVRVLDFGRSERFEPYIVMELLTGQTLGALLDDEGALSAVRAVRTLLPIAHGLAAAHKKGIVHRDLKPENIFLAELDDQLLQPKLLDFGIALSSRPDRAATGKRRVAATPEYAAPELCVTPDAIDERADIWAFCLILYESLTGIRPFLRDSAAESFRAANETESFSALAVDDHELGAIIERGIRRDPKSRWRSMQELGEALACWLLSRGVTDDVTETSLRAAWPNASGSAAPPVSVRQSERLPELRWSDTVTSAGATSSLPPREPSLLAPRPSEQPGAPDLLRATVPEARCERLRAWGLSCALLELASSDD